MQLIQPMMKQLKEKHADDPQKLNAETMALFRKHKVPFFPLGGCLVGLLQLPIFACLYQAMQFSFELRHAPFLYGVTWIQDLSSPDQLFFTGFDRIPLIGPILGPYFNLLPILSAGLMYWQMMAAQTKATTPEAQSQQDMMKIMVVMMTVMFYKVPAGLCLYIIVTSAWSMLERQFLPKPVPATTPTAQPGVEVVNQAAPEAMGTWKTKVGKKKK
jgi:YidC/Oxa1 family membrane protein insertase